MEARSRVEEVQWAHLREVIMQWLPCNSIQVTLQMNYVTLRIKKVSRIQANPFRRAEEANTLNITRDSGLIAA
jgi:hypothetical protein